MQYKWIGWCKEGNHDKVWGVILLKEPAQLGHNGMWAWTHERCVVFWGRRGKKLQTQMNVDDRELYKKIQEKEKSGYVEIQPDKLNLVYPEFENDLEKTTVYALLSA